MKKLYLVKAVLLAFLAFQFYSCENEPLTGEFPDDEQVEAGEGQFRATIEGREFIADSSGAYLSSENELEITGKKSNGEMVVLAITNAAVGSFNLNSDGTGPNVGIFFDGHPLSLPYASIADAGGSGQLKIIEMDTVAKTVTGTFSFVGVRIKLDSSGNPVLGNDGLPVMENLEITNGSFNSIPYVEEDPGGGNGGGEPDPDNEFFAKVDGVDFIADNIVVTTPIVNGVPMVNILAQLETGERMRLDVPKSLGIGIFDMVASSDGTKLIAYYNRGIGTSKLTSNPGVLMVEEFDLEKGILKANFAFTATDPLNRDPEVVEISEGRMVVHFEGVTEIKNRFKANVDVTTYFPDIITIGRDTINNQSRIIISTTSGTRQMEISFPVDIKEGIFDMSPNIIEGNEFFGRFIPDIHKSREFTSEIGTLEITNFDLNTGIVEGTFNFNASDPLEEDPTIYKIRLGDFFVLLQ